MISRALLSVSDKAGIADLARGLTELGVEVVSSGGTAAALANSGVAVTLVSDVTGFQEILGGRLKTLHPKIHGGILADRGNPEHLAELAQQGIEPIDLVVCNLYPFEHAVAHPSVKERDAIEQIDIGGPAMVRAAAKNFHSVAVVVRPADYDDILQELREHGEISLERRRSLALQAFAHTASYDAAIASYLGRGVPFPERLLLVADKVMDLRYGENPHQSAALYRSAGPATGLAAATQLHGKELSYNNLLDADAAWKLVIELSGTGCAIIKHSNPCGVALGDSLDEAYGKALECDRTSAFGGIVALNRPCDAVTAAKITGIFTEVVIAPDFDEEALELLSAKKNLRVLRADGRLEPELDIRRVSGGLLLQSPDRGEASEADDAKVVTEAEPTAEQWNDLRFAWTVAKHVKSNAIVLAKDGAAVGVGAGQMSRVESTELAARRAGDRARGTACASDAFFPFRDGLDAAVSAGAVAIIQPGGSVRDDEVIAAANEHGIPMVFTGKRHFRH
jgi:phosphoribosylaminoimidazolecarboxamide formyltransferase / IMP cyclohydrolase